eukprot:Awhi_evm1s11726
MSVLKVILIVALAICVNGLSWQTCKRKFTKSCRRLSNRNDELKNFNGQIEGLTLGYNEWYDGQLFMQGCLDSGSLIKTEAQWSAYKSNTANDRCRGTYYQFTEWDYSKIESTTMQIHNYVIQGKNAANSVKSNYENSVKAVEDNIEQLKREFSWKDNNCFKCRNSRIEDVVLNLAGTSKAEVTQKTTALINKAAAAIKKFLVQYACQIINLAFPLAGMGIDAALLATPVLGQYVAAMASNPACQGIIGDNWELQLPSITVSTNLVKTALASVICLMSQQKGMGGLKDVCDIATLYTTLSKFLIAGICGRGGTALATIVQIIVMCNVKINGENCGNACFLPCWIMNPANQGPLSRRDADSERAKYSDPEFVGRLLDDFVSAQEAYRRADFSATISSYEEYSARRYGY